MSTKHPHTAKNVYFSCIDDRLAPTLSQFIAEHGSTFNPRLAGGGAAFLDQTVREVSLKQIVAAYKINNVTDVYLESHTDCGAYRLAGIEFESSQDEITRLYADLGIAAGYVRDALNQAGADANQTRIHTQVVDPAGTIVELPREVQLSAR